MADTQQKPEQEGVVVVHTGRHGFATEIQAGHHALKVDEPARLGGTDTGPSPYTLLLGALGACTAMTLRMYADRKQWPLEGVSVRLAHQKIYAKDCADCEAKEGRLDHIERLITLEGRLDDEQRARLLEIANRCPVHQTLKSEIHVETKLG